MTINDLDTKSVTVDSVETPTSTGKGVLSPPIDVENITIGSSLGMDSIESGKNASKLKTLVEWAKTQTQDHSLDNLKWEIKKLQDRVGSPPMLEKWINHLHQFAFLDLEEARIKKEKEHLMRGSSGK